MEISTMTTVAGYVQPLSSHLLKSHTLKRLRHLKNVIAIVVGGFEKKNPAGIHPNKRIF